MHPVDIEKMAVMPPFGLFKFNCIPFGLHNADSTLQRMVDCVLAYQHFALPTEITSLWPDAITWNISFISRRLLERLQHFCLVINSSNKCVLR
jgi:hypothetical protein